MNSPADSANLRRLTRRAVATTRGHLVAIVSLPVLAATVLPGCGTVRHAAVNRLGDAIAAGGEAYASDDDPELIRAAAPFSLKLLESLLAESPRHAGLLQAACSGFTQYAYAFVQVPAEEKEDMDIAAALADRARARRLYLRARDYGLRGLEVRHPGFVQRLQRDPSGMLRSCGLADVPLLFWSAAAWGGAVAIRKDNPDLIADLPQIQAMLDRALELDEGYGDGALRTLLISMEGARTGAAGDPAERARRHFDRALALSRGTDPAPYVALAEQVSVQHQARAEFQELLRTALAIDPDSRPSTRLATLIAQRRARRLLAKVDELFAVTEETNP